VEAKEADGRRAEAGRRVERRRESGDRDEGSSTARRRAQMEYFIPGEPERRPNGVVACVRRSPAMREAERDFMIHTLVAVQMDASARLSCEAVKQGASNQLRLPEHLLQVSKLRPATYLLRFETRQQRNAALGRELLVFGRSRLHLMPWTRQFGASASNMFYRARVCIEGVPPHAEQIEVVRQLFDRRTFVQSVDHEKATEDEKACFCVWVACGDPDSIPRDGTLQVEELPEFAAEVFGEQSGSAAHVGAAQLLNYRVFLHVDRVVDYTTPPRSSYHSYASVRSGIPDDEPEVEWPLQHRFVWQLGVPDGYPVQKRVPVHERLGERRRDRSPSGGGGGFGRLDLRQFPPPSQHGFARGSDNHQGENRGRYGGGAGGASTPACMARGVALKQRRR